ncbi:IS630 family transposase [Ruegeria conchae]|nr:IS630 family transposase [Ruegeria conchae]
MATRTIEVDRKLLQRAIYLSRENSRLRTRERAAIMFMAHVSRGQFEPEELLTLIPVQDHDDFKRLVIPALASDSKLHKDRAAMITCCLIGIHPNLVGEFFGHGGGWPRRLLNRWRRRKLHALFSKPSRPKKFQDPAAKAKLFEVLHAPPSAYGVNRTTWTINLLHQVLVDSGTRISRPCISKMIKTEGYEFRKTREVLTSNDPDYREKLAAITRTLRRLGPMDRFFSIDEYGPVSVRERGGRRRVLRGEKPTVPQYQDSKGYVIVTAALELSRNQITHFYSDRKNTAEMIRLLHVLLHEYWDCRRLYLSWDAASWHSSKAFLAEVRRVNTKEYRNTFQSPTIKLRPLPARAQFLNVIESVFSGLSQSVIHNSNYQSKEEMHAAIDQYISERNAYFQANPRRAGNKIWGLEQVPSRFSVSNNCKHPKFMQAAGIGRS